MKSNVRQTLLGTGLLLASSGLFFATGTPDVSVLLAVVAVVAAVVAGVRAATGTGSTADGEHT
jgi:hypothetical protein